MSPTSTDPVMTNLGECGTQLKQAAVDASAAVRNAASAAGEELRLGKAAVKADLADGALAGLAAGERATQLAGEQFDELMDKGREFADAAAELVRERPLASFGVAFAAGWLISKLGRSSK
ncbi:hypothetical protein ACFFGH_02225 [Lysobacter korlensis]|uniref:DUF883 domain-containing protein n=1 Tax=Lysobacter korlensis TaxID=553636 RepID=A0ABV6RI52_9GAMM